MRHLHLACKSLSPDVSSSHLGLIKILMQGRGELLVRHETQDFCIGLVAGVVTTSAPLPEQPKYRLFYL